MAAGAGPDIVTDGLVLSLDSANQKSFPGEPTANLIPSPGINALPTTGNGWGTYNTNQYCGSNGCGNFWPIPAISSVSNNIVTTVSAHTMRSFDVLRPQTTGGGLTANTDYLVKKISDTQFSLHAYNSSQDGSQGYINSSTGGFKVHDSYWLDQRVSINSTDFPTMWWGAPHLPNSAIVKEIIAGGYVAPDLKATDCIRLHWFRSDATDGMAYGVDAPLTVGVPTTVSFYARAASPSAVGQHISYQNYNYGGTAGYSYYSMTATWSALGEWVRNSYTFTPTHTAIISYWFPSSGNMKVDIANIQVEQGRSYPTAFVAGTRGTTVATGGGWRDTSGKGNHVELVNGPVAPNGYTHPVIAFDGTNDYGTIPTFTNKPTTQITCEAWINPSEPVSTGTVRGGVISNTNSMYLGLFNSADGGSTHGMHWANMTTDSRPYNTNGQIPNNTWTHLVGTYDGSTSRAYINGVEVWSAAQTGTIPDGTYVVGTYGGGLTDGTHNFNGLIGDARIYNRGLTASEVLANYNKTKGKYKTM